MSELSLGARQRLFARLLAKLILWAYEQGYEVTFGDVWAKPRSPLEHTANSFHYQRLAADLNLFREGRYLTRTEDHAPLGALWRKLHPLCTWGGDFPSPDGNHYSLGEKRK